MRLRSKATRLGQRNGQAVDSADRVYRARAGIRRYYIKARHSVRRRPALSRMSSTSVQLYRHVVGQHRSAKRRYGRVRIPKRAQTLHSRLSRKRL